VLVATAAMLVIGWWALLRGWPSEIHSRLGQAEFSLLHLLASVLAMPAFMLLAWGPLTAALELTEVETRATGYLFGMAVSFAVLSVRLWWVAPYEAKTGARRR
jgi:hypothetical protein